MNFIREIIKNKAYTKKGFTLIELMLVVTIIGMITSIQVIIMYKYAKIYRQEIILSREAFYVDEAFYMIKQQIDDAKYISVKENKIAIIRSDKNETDYIRKDKDSDIILSYGNMYSSTTDNILKSIKDFKVEKEKRILYISIETKKGNIYKRCFVIEREKPEKGSF